MKHRKRKPPRIRRDTPPGASPGQVKARESAARSRIEVVEYGPDGVREYGCLDARSIRRPAGQGRVTWIDVTGLGDAAVIERVGEIFGLHRLALEDVVNVHQRAKVEEYAEHLFVVIRTATGNGDSTPEQLSLFLGDGFLLSFHERGGDCLEPVRQRLRAGLGRVRSGGADYLAYALIDAAIDSYFPVVDGLGEQLEDLDERLAASPTARVTRDLHSLRHDVMSLRRVVRPLRDAMIRLTSDPHPLIVTETKLHLRDCFDHTAQLLDLLDTYREMCSDLRDFHFSAVNNRMNETMKLLTLIATIFIPLSFVASVYGMNFDTEHPWNMPELRLPYGYPMVVGGMLLLGLGLLGYFWRKGWLTDETDKD